MDISGSLNTAANFSSIEARLDQLEATVKAQDGRIKALEARNHQADELKQLKEESDQRDAELNRF